MSPDRDRRERLEDYLDGFVSAEERARIERRLATSPEWRREHRELRALHALLGAPLDVDPPDLLPGVLAAVEARAKRRLRLPAPLENGFVLAGAAGVAALVLGVARLAPADPAGWLGRAAVVVASALGAAKDGFLGIASSIVELDWIARLVPTLVEATGAVLRSSAEPLMVVALATLVLGLTVVFLLERGGRALRGGGTHVGLLA
jgi:anti-sigma factor RsiW